MAQDKAYNKPSASSEYSEQSVHLYSLIRFFAVRSKLSTAVQRAKVEGLWSDILDAEADLRLTGLFVGLFVYRLGGYKYG